MKILRSLFPFKTSETPASSNPTPAVPAQETTAGTGIKESEDHHPTSSRFDRRFGSGIANMGRDVWSAVSHSAQGATSWLGLQINELRGKTENTVTGLKDQIAAWRNSDSAGKVGWLKREVGEPKADVTSTYQSLEQTVKTGQSVLPPDANQYKYLVVDGLFTERYPGYMSENIKHLQDQGLSVSKVSIDSDASVAANAKAVRDAVLEASASGQQVVLIGHSKGGVDATAALSLYPELTPHVRAMISMQAPYGGTPVSTDLQNCPELRPHVNRAIENMFQGDPAALQDLSYESRKTFLSQHPYPAEEIPTISLATSSTSALSLTAKAAHYIQHRYGEKSDGLVVDKDAEIPGSYVIRLQDMDHSGPVMKGLPGVSKHEPAHVTEALVAMALSLPKS